MTTPAIELNQITKTFGSSNKGRGESVACVALHNVSFKVSAGEKVALLGASGSGKSTLIRLLCGLEIPDKSRGDILVDGVSLYRSGEKSSATELYRVRSVTGVIFQQFNLVGQLSVLENVLIGLCSELSIWRILTRNFPNNFQALGLDCLDKVGLLEKADQRASTLSGGQQQRVAVARALAKGARIILADEPVASLDPESSRKVMQTLSDLTTQFGITLVVSLHQTEIAKRYCGRAIALRNGELIFDGPTTALTSERLQDLYGMQAEELFPTVPETSGQTANSTSLVF